MAEETHVLFRGKLPGRAALNRAMKELALPLTISPGIASLEGHSGYLPMKLRREETGVEFEVFEGRDAVEELAGKDADPRFERSGSFRWGGNENEMLAGLCAAAALAKLVDGRVLDEAKNRLLTVDQAIERARETLEAVLPPPDGPRDTLPGTRPADIRRYLKPLLDERDDLVLVGRSLFIRPVRHLVRGAFFHRTRDKFGFGVFRMVKPLYQPPDSIDYQSGGVGGDWRVWQPHFQPLLMKQLAEDAFARVGQITTFDDFAEHLSKNRSRSYGHPEQLERITALQLAGKADRAAAYVEQLERNLKADGDRDYIRAHWKRLSNVSALCDRLRAKEFETAKAMKLKHIWEPSPFPVELPVAERTKVAEPEFPALPWVAVASSPPLLLPPPEHPGEVRFAKCITWHNDNLMLVAPLTPTEAEERHREYEEYLLAARLPDGILAIIDRVTGWDRLKPGAIAYLRPTFHMRLCERSRDITADISPSLEDTGLFNFGSIHVHDRASSSLLWNAYLNLKHGTVSIEDSRNGEPREHKKFAISPALRDAAICQTPTFGEYTELCARLRSVLQMTGYGEIM